MLAPKITLSSLLLVASAPFLTAHAVPDTLAKGRVFHDTNENRRFDAGEPGVADVLVSNGREVVKTDASGRYELMVSEDTILFVVQPKGWRVPVNELNLPRFFYIHKPHGSPAELEFPGVEPTGPLPESVDFPLYPSDVAEQFSIFAFGDPQPYSEQDVDYFRRDIVEEARQVKGPVAGVTLGDVVGDDLDLYEPLNAAVALMGLPWWNVYGNHDMNFDVEDPELADETFERVFGPATYAFQIGNVTFISMDNVLYPNHITESRYTGGFMDRQIEFVGNLLAHVPHDHLVVTLVHIPLYEEGGRDSFVDDHRKAFFALFKDHKYTLSLSAHTHTQNHVFFDHDHHHWPHLDVPHHHYNVGTTSGSWWRGPKDERGIPDTTMRDGTPNGYAILHFDDNEYIYDWKVAGKPEDYRMSLYAPRVVRRAGWEYAFLAVNFFNGSAQAKVEYRVDEGDWREARHQDIPDPLYAYNRFKVDLSDEPIPVGEKSLPPPQNSSHIWTARLPTNLPAGEYTIEVRVTDRFERVFTDSTHYRIVED